MDVFGAILGIVGDVGKKIAGNLFPNPEDELKRLQLQQELQKALIEQQGAINTAAADIVKTEAASSSWLTCNWRPITMMVFLGLLVARVFGWTSPNVTPSEYDHLWQLLEIGIGGYIGGRSVEKVAPAITEIFTKK